MYVVYDLEENAIASFDTIKELAKYFSTSVNCMRSCVSKYKHGVLKKKRDKALKKWFLIKVIELEEI